LLGKRRNDVPDKPQEQELESFLKKQPVWLTRALVECNTESLTSADPGQLVAFQDYVNAVLEEYHRLLRRVPTWKAYRNVYRRKWGSLMTDIMLAANPAGAPRKDALAAEATELRQHGKSPSGREHMSYAEIAKDLMRRQGINPSSDEAITKDAIRMLLKSRDSNKG
jgi:hypothetical protein